MSPCKVIYICLKIEYQSETDFIYHENLRFKKKEKSLRKIKESKRMTRHKGTYIKSQNKSAIQVRENLCQSDCHTICKEITIIFVRNCVVCNNIYCSFLGGKGISIKIYYIKV